MATPPAVRARPRLPRQVALETSATTLLRAAEVAFAVVAILLYSEALVPLWLRVGGTSLGPTSEGNPVLRGTFAALHLGTALLCLIRWRPVLAAAGRHRPTIALVGLSLVSVVWSAAPDVTLRRALALVLTTAFGVWLAARFDLRSLLRVLSTALLLGAVLSVAFAVGLPEYGIDTGDHAGAWRGIFPQKNGLGQIMVLAAVTALLYSRVADRGRWLLRAGALLAAGLVVLSTSKTALAVMVALVLLIPLLRTLRFHYTVAVPILVTAVLVGTGVVLVGIASAETVLLALGKDPSLTGRIPMWEVVIDMIQERPWLGYGFSAFWLGAEGPSAAVMRVIEWRTPHAHNGLLDVALQLGLLGVGILLYGLLTATVRVVGAIRDTHSTEALWPALLLAFTVLYNVTETSILQQNRIYWVLYVAAVCAWVRRRGAEGEEGAEASPSTVGRMRGPRAAPPARVPR